MLPHGHEANSSMTSILRTWKCNTNTKFLTLERGPRGLIKGDLPRGYVSQSHVGQFPWVPHVVHYTNTRCGVALHELH